VDIKDLEARIKERKEQAIKKGLFEKASSIFRFLGYVSKKYGFSEGPCGYGGLTIAYYEFHFESGSLRVIGTESGQEVIDGDSCDLVRRYGPEIKIFHQDELVYSAKGSGENKVDYINVYIPGTWEDLLPNYYNQTVLEDARRKKNAQIKKERLIKDKDEKQKRLEEERIQDLKKRFGL